MKDPVADLCRRLDELQRRRDELGDRTDAEAIQARGLLDELEAGIQADVRRYAEAVRARSVICLRCRRGLQVVRGMNLPCACSWRGDFLVAEEIRPSPASFSVDVQIIPLDAPLARFRKKESLSESIRWFEWEEVAT